MAGMISSNIELRAKKRNLKDAVVALTVIRRTGDTAIVKVKTDAEAGLNIYLAPAKNFLEFKVRNYSFFESLPAGVSKGWETLIANIKNFKLLFTSKEVKASESLGSFLSIGNMFGAEWDWERFWGMTALLSIVLAFMNILPIPALDGGHVIFTLYEMITGRKPGEKFLEYAQMVWNGIVVITDGVCTGSRFLEIPV